MIQGAFDLLRESGPEKQGPLPLSPRTHRTLVAPHDLTVRSLLWMAREEHRLNRVGLDVPFDRSFHDMVEEFRPLLGAGVRLEARLEAVPFLGTQGRQNGRGDPVAGAMLIVALANLLRNAVDHTNEGRISVEVSTAAAVVADTGQGIDGDVLERINDSWQSAPEVGLGLAIVHRVCRRFGWRFKMQSEPGRGTTARIFFTPDRLSKVC